MNVNGIVVVIALRTRISASPHCRRLLPHARLIFDERLQRSKAVSHC